MHNTFNIGIDLGGTNLRGGIVHENALQKIISRRINAKGSTQEVLEELFSITDQLIDKSVTSIGIGVPGLVNAEKGIIYDVVYIPSWKEVPLQKWMEDRYQVPVFVDNDANCFALGEYYFGKGKSYDSLIGLTIGTGLGSGIIINKKLYTGKNGGAGEFGMIDYLDHCYEYYASGQFFQNIYQTDGEVVFKDAKRGDATAIKMYQEMGSHLGKFIKMILYSLDIELIIIGGSVRQAWPWFNEAMWEQIHTFAFQKSLQHFQMEISELENAGILGAAALQYDFENKK
jgi:glucokinase